MTRKRNLFLYDLLDVVSVNLGDHKYFTQMKTAFWNRLNPLLIEEKEIPLNKGINLEDADNQMTAFFRS